MCRAAWSYSEQRTRRTGLLCVFRTAYIGPHPFRTFNRLPLVRNGCRQWAVGWFAAGSLWRGEVKLLGQRPDERSKAALPQFGSAQQLFRTKRPNSSLLLDLLIDGKPLRRRYYSPKYWAALFHFAVADGREIIVQDMDLPGRFARLFPLNLMGQLRWFENHPVKSPPVSRLFDPDGTAEILLLRSLYDGLAVEVVHNLKPGGYSRETLWLADIMALRPMINVNLRRDVEFS